MHAICRLFVQLYAFWNVDKHREYFVNAESKISFIIGYIVFIIIVIFYL